MQLFSAALPFAALALTSAPLTAQVSEWSFAKGAVFQQTADDTAPTLPVQLVVLIDVQTSSPSDATSATISGGGLPSPLALQQDQEDWEATLEFPGLAAMNALFPSNTTYTLTLSGGTLGTVTQSFLIGPEEYPAIPYFTGSVWSGLPGVSTTAPTTITWNDPGPFVTSGGSTVFQVYDTSIDNEVFAEEVAGGATSAVLSSGTLQPETTYETTLLFINDDTVSGAGGFVSDGRVGHVTALVNGFETINAALVATRNGGANPLSYAAGDPVLGASWSATVDLAGTTGHSHAQILGFTSPVSVPLAGGQVLLVGGPRVFTLPLAAGPVASWTATLPSDLALAGMTVYTQAAHVFGVTPYALSNAQDLTLGS